MTASGSHKKGVIKRSSLLRILQSASRSFDGLRFSSLLHKERSRMAKGMSPLRLFMRNQPRKVVPDSVDGGSSGMEATSGVSQSRQPLGPIMITETIGNPIPLPEHSSGEPSTPQAKSKISSQGEEKFPYLENSERHAVSSNVPPDKTANLPSKAKFTWQHRHGPVAHNTTREGPPDLSTPPRPPKWSVSSDGQAAALSANNQDTSQTSRVCSTGGGSVQSTPKGGRSVGSKATNELENCGSQSQNSTPCRTVPRSLKYSQQGSSSNSGASGITNIRSAASQHVITRPMGYLQAVKGGVPQNFVENHFELEEDASFWCDHNVQVIIRTRPMSNSELAAQGSNRCLKQESPHTVSWLGQPESRFTFDHVAGEIVTQAKLFDVAGLPMVENCMSGYNSCMFAYGQTGSGKTHTMLGDIENLDRNPSENRGMTPRVFEYLFGRIRKEQECRRLEHLKFSCKCSFLEIYNEQITDLLEPSSTNLQMREDAKKGVYVENLSEVEVQCVQDVIQLLLQGASNRKVAATNMNRESSRSHSVFTCVVESKWENNSMTNSRYGRLHLVDLAGSERQKSSGAEGGRLKEAANINRSLSTLGLVIMILVDVANGKQRHVPYRDSKLTFLLQDSLGGNSKTIMIANVSPSSCCAMETLSTLKFAQRAKFIRNNAVINEDASGDVIALRQRIEELKCEVDRLRRESVLRISSSRVLALESSSTAGQACGDKLNCAGTEGFATDSVYAKNSQIISIANNDQHLRSMEAVLAGALRREQQAEDITKKLAAEIEQLNRLVRQREEDSQCSKMMLRFREEKIRRLEGIADNVLSAESSFADERKNLIEELRVIRSRLDRNPELTRFAMENIRLMEELRRYQEFYDGGERDVLLEEISGLRSQLLEKLDIKLGQEQAIAKLSTPQKRALAPEMSTLERENALLLIEVKNYQNELKECRKNLNSFLAANADLARQVDELQATVKELQSERSERHDEQMEVPTPHPQQAASTCTEAVCGIPLETEELAYQQRVARINVEEQVTDLKNQLQEAQDLISQLSSEVARSKLISDDAGLDGRHGSDGRKVHENVTCVAEDDAVYRQGFQDRWEKLQEIEMRHAEEITRLQLELDIMEDVVKEDRQQRSLTERKNEELSSQLSAAVSQLEQGQALVEDGLEEEKQRLIAERKCEELSTQLSASLSQLEQQQVLVDDMLTEERQQRLVATQKCEELSSQLSDALSQLQQGQALADDDLKEEKQLRLEAEQTCEALGSQLSAAVSQLEQGQALVEDRLKGERQQLLIAEKKCEELSSQLSAAVSQSEEGQALAEDALKEVQQQRLVAEQKCEELSSRLSAAISQLEEAQALAEDTLQDEKRQRLVVEEKCEELSSQLRSAVSQLEEGESQVDDRVKVEKQQRLEADQKFEEVSCQLRAVSSQLEQGESLLEDRLKEEKQQLSVAEEKCENLSRQLSAALSQRDQSECLMEDKVKDERQQRLTSEQKCVQLSSQLRAALSELQQAQCLVEALEGQQLFSIKELEDLQSEHTELLRKMKQNEEEQGELRKQFQDESNLDYPAVSILEEELLRARRGKEEARRMIRQFQEEKESRMVLEKEREATMSEVETQAALAIITLQSEILELREEVSLAVESETTAKLRIAHLQKEVETLQQTTCRLEDNNRLLSDTYRDQVDEKNAQLRALEAQWECSTSKLIEYLSDGDKSLTEAAKVIDEINQGKVQEVSQTGNGNIVQSEDEAAAVFHHLHDVHLMLREAEGQLRALGDAAATSGETTSLDFEDGEALIRESEKKSMVAFCMVRELLERVKDLKSAQHKLIEENQQAYSKVVAKGLEIASLQQQLEEVRRQFGELNVQHQLVVRKHEDLTEEHDKTASELQTKNVQLEEEIDESRRALAEKDEENGNIHKQLDEIQTQSTVIADRYQVLMATHHNLEQEQVGYLKDQALKAEEGEHLIRLSERKAMAALVMVEQLVGNKNELKEANMALMKEIQDGHLLLSEKQAALATLKQRLDEDTQQRKEVSDQYQVLVETHADLQQEIEMLIADKDLRAAACEIASAEALSTEGALKSEVYRLESSLKQAECRVSEMLTAVTALTVAKEELELERSRLVQVSGQAEMNCREKEHELVTIQGDLAGVIARVAETELREKSISGRLEEFAVAKEEWEVNRAVLTREIEEMRKEKAQCQLELNYLNAEVEERETAIFEGFKRSQAALKLAETKLTTIDEELRELGAVEENLKQSIAFFESASSIAMVAFDGNEDIWLKMQKRVQNAEVHMPKMQIATDLAVDQFTLEKKNWEVEKRRLKLEKDARETELCDEIAAAELKLMATEGSLKTAVEHIDALALRKVALEGEVRKLHENAKISLLKVTEQQQEIDSLRQMSLAFKAECKAADDSVAALNLLREQYILAEGNWRSEQELLTTKLEELEISVGLQSKGGGGEASSDDSTDGGEFSQCVPEFVVRSEERKPSEEFQLQRRQQDNQVLRKRVSEKERTILSAKKELQIAVANCKETEEEIDKVHLENRRLIQIELENRSLIDILSGKLRTAEEELQKRDRKIKGCETELLKVAGIISDWETKMQDAENEWRRDKEVLAQELTEARLVANEKKTEAASILQKFQDGQATLKEAGYLMDALVQANESAKHEALDWKIERERLDIVQGWWMPERDKLVSEIARLETDMHTQKQDVVIICKEAVIGLVGTMDVLSSVEQELHELENDHREEMEHLVGEMKVLKDDLVSRLQFQRDLQLEPSPRNIDSDAELETMSRMPDKSENSHCDREEALKMTLLELEHSRSELASVQVNVCHLQVELENQSKAVRDYDEKLRSAQLVNVELLQKYNHGVMQWEDEREECLKELMEERLKQLSLGEQLEETKEARDESLSEIVKLRNCLKAPDDSYQTCSSELLAFTREVSAEGVFFKQLEMGWKHLIVDIEEVKDQTLVVLVDELRADHEEIRNITCQMFALRNEVVQLGNLCTAIVHVGQEQLADLTKERQSNQFVQLYQQELEITREILTESLSWSEILVSQLQEISVELEDLTSRQDVGTMNFKFRSDFGALKVEILNFQKTAEEKFRVWTLRSNIAGQESEKLMATVQDLQTKNSLLNSELDERSRSIDILEGALVSKEQKITLSLEMVNSQLKAVEQERDRYQTDLVVLNEQLDMAQSLADERDLVAAEARQAAELSKTHAEQKEEEARILERSVEELESTISALETQLDIVRRESKRQRVEREALEKELETLKHQMGLMQLTIDRQEAQAVRGLQDAEASKTELDRMVIEMKSQQVQARKSVESLQQECAEKDIQLRSSKAYISELVLGAEKQAAENQQKLKTLEAMVEHLKVEDRKANPSGGSVGKPGEKSTGKVKGPGSPFKCIGSGLEKQRSSDMDEELSAAKKRIKELESASASRQKEVFMLNTKLAEAESMTHDVIRDLLGVKVDIASYASLLNQQQVQRIAERAKRRTAEAQQKEEELDTLRVRLNEFIEERESWLEEINRRQAEAVAARVSAEKLRLRDQTLTTENETFREDCLVLRKKVTELEDEIKKLSGQQNLQQRIHHHAKIKEENNSIRLQNEDLSGKLRRMEILFTRVNDELARYRTAEGKSAFLNFDEEARLQKKLQETEDNRLHLAETIIGLCAGIMQAAGIQKTSRDLDPSAAIAVLQQLQDRQESLERDLSDYKLQARIAVEKRRLSDLRDFHTPVKTVSTGTNFTASQQLPSPVSSSR